MLRRVSSTEHHRDDWDAIWADMAGAAEANPAQGYRRRLALDALNLGQGARLLDIGSGQGDLARDIVTAHPGVELAGLELGASGISESLRKVPNGRFEQIDLLSEQPFPADLVGWANFAVCSEVLEHIDDPVRLLRRGLEGVALGGRVVVTVPGGPMSKFDKVIGHRQHFTAASLGSLMEEAGLRVTRTYAAGFPFHNLYRAAVIARGDALVNDARSGRDESAVGRAVATAFRGLFRANLPSTPWGWQIVGVGHKA